jgi:hypothetical protein
MRYILDTNVYRNLIRGKNHDEIQKAISKLKLNGKNQFIFSSIVFIELINHLTIEDSAKQECYNALFAKFSLCSEICNDRKKGELIPEFNELLSLYFNQKNGNYFNFNKNLLITTEKITQNNDIKNIILHKKLIQEIINYKESELINIISNIEKFYLTNISSNIKDWSIYKNNPTLKLEFKNLLRTKKFHDLFALSLINLNLSNNSKSNTPSKTEFIKFKKDFKITIDFFIENIWKKFIDIEKIEYFSNPDSDPKKRWNSFYDTQIIMACEYNNSIGIETQLVTSEKKILTHFEKHSKRNWCISLEEFLEHYRNIETYN